MVKLKDGWADTSLRLYQNFSCYAISLLEETKRTLPWQAFETNAYFGVIHLTFHMVWQTSSEVSVYLIAKLKRWISTMINFQMTNKLYMLRQLLNNYWMRLSMISWIIKAEVCVISRSLRQICFIIHFSHNSSEAFRHFVPEENTPRGLVTRQTMNLTW